jgi:acyl carrier protein
VTEQEVYAGLTEIVRDLFGDDTIVLSAATTAHDVDGWDSFNHLNIIAAAEMRFGVKFRTKEIEKLTSIGEMVALILQKTR